MEDCFAPPHKSLGFKSSRHVLLPQVANKNKLNQIQYIPMKTTHIHNVPLANPIVSDLLV